MMDVFGGERGFETEILDDFVLHLAQFRRVRLQGGSNERQCPPILARPHTEALKSGVKSQ